jgi:uncharacterized protein with von Willebrand factor type A (vWA) domain
MFDLLLLNLRSQGVQVGLGEWLAFLDGIQKGLVVELDGLYDFGRAVLVHSEAHFDAWDLSFQATFAGVKLEPVFSEQLLEWLAEAKDSRGETVDLDMDWEELRRQFLERLAEQKERHDGGSKWVGTGGTSPFGTGGRSRGGIQLGGGGARSAMAVAGDREWRSYRTDKRLQSRDFQVALRALRKLTREGQLQLDIDGTIDKTSKCGGEIELAWERSKENRVHLVLILDTGGSMDPHTRLVTQLFSAAKALKGFKSFEAYHFHNAPYGYLYRDYATRDRVSIPEVLSGLSSSHRLVWVGDASMAPWELFGQTHSDPWGSQQTSESLCGLQWVQRFQQRCPASIWLNPDDERYWNHPTVRAIGGVVPMFPLTLDGLRDGVKKLAMPV